MFVVLSYLNSEKYSHVGCRDHVQPFAFNFGRAWGGIMVSEICANEHMSVNILGEQNMNRYCPELGNPLIGLKGAWYQRLEGFKCCPT
jgi:hypothetical protein